MQTCNGKYLLNDPFLNKGTAFSEKERQTCGLYGLLPPAIHTLTEQVAFENQKIAQIDRDYEKNKYLMTLYNENRTLFYAVLDKHPTAFLPIIYTPTIADAVIHYSQDYFTPHGAVFLDTDKPEQIKQALENASANLDQIDLLVITDGEGILGIGDWGANGVMIGVGKLIVYTLAAGIDPRRALPVVIDNGTNREELLNDPCYIGKRKKRKSGNDYLSFIDRFIQETQTLFPNVLFHWEDFGRNNASVILKRHQGKICTFNDDIQGTGMTMVAAMDAISEITKKAIHLHKYVIFGAGTAGVGIADQIKAEMRLAGLTEQEAVDRFYLVDRQGLLMKNTPHLTDDQKRYAKDPNDFNQPLSRLADIIDAVQPSVLIGSSGQPGSFTKEIVTKMCSYNERPAILPISNPTNLSEATAKDIIHWSAGKALVVTGGPSEPVKYNGITYQIGQANNALLYPGLGLGITVSKAKTVTDKMFSAASRSIASLQNVSVPGAPLLPPIKHIKEVSKHVAQSVVKAAIEENVNQTVIKDINTALEKASWKASYEEENRLK